MRTVSLPWLHCPVCVTDRAFEAPECLDGHGPHCPDLACTSCGTVISLGSVVVRTAPAVEIHAAA